MTMMDRFVRSPSLVPESVTPDDRTAWRYKSMGGNHVGRAPGRRYHNLSSFFVSASVLHLQQRLLRLAHDVRDRVPERWQQAIELRTRACDIIQLTPIEYSGDYGAFLEEVLTSAEQMPKEPGPG